MCSSDLGTALHGSVSVASGAGPRRGGRRGLCAGSGSRRADAPAVGAGGGEHGVSRLGGQEAATGMESTAAAVAAVDARDGEGARPIL